MVFKIYSVSNTWTEIWEVRLIRIRFPDFFDIQNKYSKKLSSVSWQSFCDEYTRKASLTDAPNFGNLHGGKL